MDPSLENLKDLVTQTLEKKGVLAKIRAELRASVFLAIDEQGTKAGVEANFTRAGSLGIAELQKHPHGGLLYNLVREYLEWCDLDYTLKVFVPESNVSVGHMSRGALEDALKLGGGGTSSDAQPLLLRILEQFLGKQDGGIAGSGGAYGSRIESSETSNPLGALPSLGSGLRRSPLGLSTLAPVTSSRTDAGITGSSASGARGGLSALASGTWGKDDDEDDEDGDVDVGPPSNKGRVEPAKEAGGSSAFLKAGSISDDLYTTTYRGGVPYHGGNKNEMDRRSASEGSDVDEEFEEDFEIASEGGKSDASSKSSGAQRKKQEESRSKPTPLPAKPSIAPAPAPMSSLSPSVPASSSAPTSSLSKPSLSSTDPRSLNSLLSNPLAPAASLRPGPLGPLPSLGHTSGASSGLEPLRGIPPIAGRAPPPERSLSDAAPLKSSTLDAPPAPPKSDDGSPPMSAQRMDRTPSPSDNSQKKEEDHSDIDYDDADLRIEDSFEIDEDEDMQETNRSGSHTSEDSYVYNPAKSKVRDDNKANLQNNTSGLSVSDRSGELMSDGDADLMESADF